jgi:hypothetical protein
LTILILNHCFYPDVVSTAQHATDLAKELARRGHAVTVFASRRGYDDPGLLFPSTEVYGGVRIERLRCSGFGKGARWRRAADFATFYAACLARLARAPRFDAVIAMTSPPLISYLAAKFVRFKGGFLHLWVMDLNPDQAVAAGWLRESSTITRVMKRFLRYALQHATRIVVLDRFMSERLAAKGVPREKIATVPPWTHDHTVRYDLEGRTAFRRLHGMDDKFVVMYSGNHSPCHPLDTLLSAVVSLAMRPDIVFCFVGGGSEFGKVQRFATERALTNVICLPYQPLEQLSASLSAADLHVVVMGDPFVGIVHPCKVYNVLRLGIPILYVGPAQSHVTDLIPEGSKGYWSFLARHGDADAVIQQIQRAADAGPRRYGAEMELGNGFSQEDLMGKIVGLVEGDLEASAKESSEAEKSKYA